MTYLFPPIPPPNNRMTDIEIANAIGEIDEILYSSLQSRWGRKAAIWRVRWRLKNVFASLNNPCRNR